MTYSLLHSSVLLSGSGPNPWGAPATAILSDGTFLVASRVDDATELVRLWHLAPDLSVLGSSDIVMGASDSPAPYLVATGMHAVLITRVGWTPKTFATYLIDCTGSTPSAGSALFMATSNIPTYDYSNTFHVYDSATSRIMLLTSSFSAPNGSMLQVFSSATGALLSEAKVADGIWGGYPIGLYMDPSDHTNVAAFLSSSRQANFTVALDGSSCSSGGSSVMAGIPTSGILQGAAGSPYIAGGPGLVAESYTTPYPVNYYAADGTIPCTAAGAGGEYVNLFGPAVTLNDSRHLIAYAEMSNGTWFEGRLFAVDQGVVPATMEQLALPYPAAGYSYVFDIALMAVDQTTGIILIGATVRDSSYVVSLILWTVQGPPGRIPINQQNQRADGFGRGGVPMARGNGTQQASNAARGAH